MKMDAVKVTNEAPLAYRVKDFCRLVGISASTFWKLTADGKIKVTRIGGRTLIPATEANRIVADGVK